MRRAALGGVVVVLLQAWPAAIVRAADRSTEPQERTRAVVALVTGGSSVFDRSKSMTGAGDTARDGSAIRLGLTVAGEYRVANRWSLAGTFGLSQWIDGAAVDAGYQYRGLDLGLAPRFLIHRWSGWLVANTLELSVPLGVSKPFVTVPERRAFSEQMDISWGWYAGGIVDLTVLFHLSQVPHSPSLGLRPGAGYVRRAGHRRTTFTPTDAAQAPIVEETDLVDHELLITIAAVLAF